jgi:hypothetical protein
MLTRPFYKKVLSLFGVAKAEAAKPIVHKSEFPLTPPEAEPEPSGRKTKATKGAFGKCRYRFDTHKVTDPAFNHSLRRKT